MIKFKILYIISGLFLLISPASQGTEVPFTIIHFSDSHSYILGVGERNPQNEYLKGGIARLATFIANTRSTDSNVMVFHSGDVFTGDFYFNKYFSFPEYDVLSKLNLDAIAVGNHEFDAGPQVLYNSLDSGFHKNAVPLVSANLNLNGFPALNEFIYPYIIKQYDSVKVGIFGLTINDPSSNPFPVVISDSVIQAANATTTALINQGCDVIICLSHMGYEFDNLMASVVPGIHIILGGHDHFTTAQPVFVPNPAGFSTIICHPGSHYRFAGRLRFEYENGTVEFKNYSLVEMQQGIPENTEIKNYVNSFKQGIRNKYGDVFQKVSYAKRNIPPSWNDSGSFRDTPLGNLVTDAHRNLTNTQISMTAVGLTAETIYKGDVTGYDVLRASPYGYDTTTGLGFNMMKFNITGAELKRGLELIFAIAANNVSYFPQFAGLRFDYDKTLPIGQRVIPSSMFVNDTAFSGATNYSASANAGLLLALSQLGLQITNLTPTFIPEYTCIKNYVSTFDTLDYVSTGRIKEVNATFISGSATTFSEYKLYNNYPNPFNPETNIRFSLPKNGNVVIKIFDISGKEIAEAVNKFYRAGEHTLKFDAKGLSSGVYFYRMTVGEYVETRRMVVVR
ncbi:MAG: 5'-nucleotidase C-terminal domain-containing protein [Candidatus Kapaibacterium sp.]